MQQIKIQMKSNYKQLKVQNSIKDGRFLFNVYQCQEIVFQYFPTESFKVAKWILTGSNPPLGCALALAKRNL